MPEQVIQHGKQPAAPAEVQHGTQPLTVDHVTIDLAQQGEPHEAPQAPQEPQEAPEPTEAPDSAPAGAPAPDEGDQPDPDSQA